MAKQRLACRLIPLLARIIGLRDRTQLSHHITDSESNHMAKQRLACGCHALGIE